MLALVVQVKNINIAMVKTINKNGIAAVLKKAQAQGFIK